MWRLETVQILPKAYFQVKSFHGRITSPPTHNDLPPRHLFPMGRPYAKYNTIDNMQRNLSRPPSFHLHSWSRVKRSHQFGKMYSKPIVHQGAKVTTSLAGVLTGPLLLSFSGTSSSNCSPARSPQMAECRAELLFLLWVTPSVTAINIPPSLCPVHWPVPPSVRPREHSVCLQLSILAGCG